MYFVETCPSSYVLLRLYYNVYFLIIIIVVSVHTLRAKKIFGCLIRRGRKLARKNKVGKAPQPKTKTKETVLY